MKIVRISEVLLDVGTIEEILTDCGVFKRNNKGLYYKLHDNGKYYLSDSFCIKNAVEQYLKLKTDIQEIKTENNKMSKQEDINCNLPSFNDWADIQKEAYDECYIDLINDDSPITAYTEWLQKKYPNGIKINKL